MRRRRFGDNQIVRILDEPIIIREEAAGTRDFLIKALLGLGISEDMLKVAMELGKAEAIDMSVEKEIGVAFISRLPAERGLELGYISEIHVSGMNLKRDIYLARCKWAQLSRAQLEY